MSTTNSSEQLSAEIRNVANDDAARTAFVAEQVKLAMELYRTNIQLYDSNLAVLLVCLETFDVVRGETIEILCALTVLAILIELDLSTIQMSQCTSYIQLSLASVRTHDAARVAAKTFALALRHRGTNEFVRTQTDVVMEWIALTDQSQAMRSRRLCGLLVLCEVAVRSPMIIMPKLGDIIQHLWGTIASTDEEMHNAAMQLLNLCTKLLCDRPSNVRSEIYNNLMKQLRMRMTAASTAKRIVGLFAFKVIVPNTVRLCCVTPTGSDTRAEGKAATDRKGNGASAHVSASTTSSTAVSGTSLTKTIATNDSFEELMSLLEPTIASMSKYFKDMMTALSLYTSYVSDSLPRDNNNHTDNNSNHSSINENTRNASQANSTNSASPVHAVEHASLGASTSRSSGGENTAHGSAVPAVAPSTHGLIENMDACFMDKPSTQLCLLLMQCLFVMCRFQKDKFVQQRHLQTTVLIALGSARALCFRATAFKTLNDLISFVGRDAFVPYVHPTCAEIQRIFCESPTPSWEGLRCLSTICIYYSASHVQSYINASIEHVLGWGICAQLIECMRIIIATSNGSYRAQLEETMLDMISFTLCGMPFRNHSHSHSSPSSASYSLRSMLCSDFFASSWSRVRSARPTGTHLSPSPPHSPPPSSSSSVPVTGSSEDAGAAGSAGAMHGLRDGEPTPLEVTVALEALPKFGLSDSELMADFLRHTVLPFVNHSSNPVREAAVKAIATLLLPPGDPRDLSASRRMCVNTVIAHMLAVAVSDTNAMIRLTILKAFDEKFYPYLSEPSFLLRFYYTLGDEHIQCRMAALETFAGMIPCDPAHILPSLREQMTSIMHFITNTQNAETVRDGLQLLTVLTKKAPQFTVNFSRGIVCALFPYFAQLTPASPLLLPFMDCCCAVFRAMSHFPHGELNLLPHVEAVCQWLESMPPEESMRAARLACLRFLCAAVRPVMQGELIYKALPRLFFLLSSMVRRSYDDRAVRLEAVRCLGVIGAVDPRVFGTLHLDRGAKKEMPMRLLKMAPTRYSCSLVLFHAILVQLRFKEQRSIVVRDNILRTSLQTIIRVVQHCPAARRAISAYIRPLGRVICDYSGGCMLASVLYDYTTLLRLLGSHVRSCATEVFRVFDHVWENIPDYRFLVVRMVGTLFHRDALLRMRFTHDYLRALPIIFDAMSAARAPRELRYAVIGVILQQDDTLQGCCEHVVTNLLHIMTNPDSSAELIHATVLTLRVICSKLYVDELTGSIVRTLLALLTRTLAASHRPGHGSRMGGSQSVAGMAQPGRSYTGLSAVKSMRDESHTGGGVGGGGTMEADRYYHPHSHSLLGSGAATGASAGVSSASSAGAMLSGNAVGDYADVTGNFPLVSDTRRAFRIGGAHAAAASSAQPLSPSHALPTAAPPSLPAHVTTTPLWTSVMSVFCVLIERMQGEFLRYATSIVTVLKTYGQANTEFVTLCGTLLEGHVCERAAAVVRKERAETRALQRCCERVMVQALQHMGDPAVSGGLASATGDRRMRMATSTCSVTMEGGAEDGESEAGGEGCAASPLPTFHTTAGASNLSLGVDESGWGAYGGGAGGGGNSSHGHVNSHAAMTMTMSGSGGMPLSSGAPPAMLRECDMLPVDETSLMAAFKTLPVRREEWLKWIDHVALLLMQESPFQAFRCASRPMFMNVTTLVEKVPQLTRDVFFMTFHAMDKYASRSLKYTIMDFMQQTFREAMSPSSTIPNEVLLVLLSTVELMEHTSWGYTGSTKDIAECAHKRSMLAKALFWSEITYRAHPQTTVESLISIYGELHMVDSAVGLLNTVSNEQRKGLLQSSLVTLGRFGEALRLTEEELRECGVVLEEAVVIGTGARAKDTKNEKEEEGGAVVVASRRSEDSVGGVLARAEGVAVNESSVHGAQGHEVGGGGVGAPNTRMSSSHTIAALPRHSECVAESMSTAGHKEDVLPPPPPPCSSSAHLDTSSWSCMPTESKGQGSRTLRLPPPLDGTQLYASTALLPRGSSLHVLGSPAALAHLSISTPITQGGGGGGGTERTLPAVSTALPHDNSSAPPACAATQPAPSSSEEQIWTCQVRRLRCLSELGEFAWVLQEWKRMYAEFDSRVMRSAAASAELLAAGATSAQIASAESRRGVSSVPPGASTSVGTSATSRSGDRVLDGSRNNDNDNNNNNINTHDSGGGATGSSSSNNNNIPLMTSTGASTLNTSGSTYGHMADSNTNNKSQSSANAATLATTATTTATTSGATRSATDAGASAPPACVKTSSDEDGNILYYVSRYAADACIHLQDFDSLRNVLPWVPYNTVQYHVAHAALSIATGDLTVARTAVKEGRSLLLDELADLLQESYRHAYHSLVVAQQLTELDEMIHARASVAKFKSDELLQGVRRVWGQRIAIMEPSVAMWKAVLSTRGLLIPPPQDVDMRLRFVKLCRHERAVQLERFSLDQLLGCSRPSYDQLTDPHANPCVVMQYIKYLSATQGFGSESACAQEADFIRTVIRQHAGRVEEGRAGVLARAYVRLGSLVPSLSESRECFFAATQLDPHWHVGWRRWANVNVALMSCGCANVAHDSATSGAMSPKRRWDGDGDGGGVEEVNHKGDDLLHATESSSPGTGERADADPSSSAESTVTAAAAVEQESRRLAAFTNAVEGYVQSILLGTLESTIMQDVLKLLTLWSQHGDTEHGRRVLRKRVFDIPSRVWRLVVPQLIARLDTGSDASCAIIAQIVQEVAYDYPHILLYPLNLCVLSNSVRRRRWASATLDKLQARDGALVQQGRCVIHELIRIAATLSEQWYEKLEAAANAFFGRQSVEDMEQILMPLHASLDATPETIMDAQFIMAHRATLGAARDWLRSYARTRNVADVHAAWRLYHTVFKEIEELLKSSNTLCMEYCSPILFEAHDLAIGIPTRHTTMHTCEGGWGQEEVLRIAYFDNNIRVIASKQRPKRISVMTTHGRQHRFLLKGREDLRLDERVMQLFQLVNVLMMSDSRSSGNDGFQIQHYSVMPLCDTVGMIGWVDGCDTLHKVVKDYRAHCQVPLELEMHLLGQIITLDNVKAYDCLTVMSKVEVMEFLADFTSGHDIRRAMVIAAPTTEAWVRRRSRYTASLAHMSMVGYILGLGDRHPNNVMLQESSGRVVHIDFSDCFEVAIMRERFPEKVPFRLTRMLRQALDMSGVDGAYRSCAEQCMTVLRQNCDSVLALLEAFLQDPLISWRLVNRPGQQPASSNDRKSIEEQIKINQEQSNKDLRAMPQALSLSNSSGYDNHPPLIHSVTKDMVGEEVDLVHQGILMFKRLSTKLRGKDFVSSNGVATLDVPAQVGRLIMEATDVTNIAQSWSGWYPYW